MSLSIRHISISSSNLFYKMGWSRQRISEIGWCENGNSNTQDDGHIYYDREIIAGHIVNGVNYFADNALDHSGGSLCLSRSITLMLKESLSGVYTGDTMYQFMDNIQRHTTVWDCCNLLLLINSIVWGNKARKNRFFMWNNASKFLTSIQG